MKRYRLEDDSPGERPFMNDFDAVNRFCAKMLQKLRENSFKRHWDDMPIDDLLNRLKEEMAELEEAIKAKDLDNIPAECADVSNFCMMISEKVRNG